MRRLACLLLALSAFATPVHADDLGEARKEFRAAQKHEDWKEREDAYVVLAGYDSAAAAKEALLALTKEKNAAVIYTGVRCLAMMKSTGAQDTYRETLVKGKPLARLYVLMALDAMSASGLTEAMEGVLAGKDDPAIAQAAMALGRRQSVASIPKLLPLLSHKAWQVRRGAAMALLALASPPAPKDPGSNEPRTLPAPDAMRTPEVVQALVKALAQSTGSERTPMLRTLKRITQQDFGLDVNAWKQLAAGKSADEIVRKPVTTPHIFGIPILGRRVVIVFDRSLRMSDPHPFRKEGRLEEVCDVPDGRPVPWMRMTRTRHFAAAHVHRLFSDMDKKSRLEVVLFNNTVKRVFNKFVGPGAGNKKLLKETLDELQVDEGINAYGALTQALDAAGAKEKQAWKSGPDEIVFITVNVPTAGDVKDPNVLASAIGLKARFRMVPVHTVGIQSHSYDMLRQIAKQTGGIYRNYYE